MITPEEAMWFVGGTGIQTEGEIEESYLEDDSYEILGLIIVGIIIVGIFIYFKFFL